jgi:hypothetical protein
MERIPEEISMMFLQMLTPKQGTRYITKKMVFSGLQVVEPVLLRLNMPQWQLLLIASLVVHEWDSGMLKSIS